MKKGSILSMIMLLACAFQTMAAEVADITIADATAEPGATVTVPVTISGRAAGFQLKVYMPEGVTLDRVLRGDVIKVLDDNEEYVFSFASNVQEDGGCFILGYSVMNVLTPEAGEIAKLRMTVGSDVAPGVYDIRMTLAETSYGSSKLSTYSDKTTTLTVTMPTSVGGVQENKPMTGTLAVYNTAGQLLKTVEGTYTPNGIVSDLKVGTYVIKGNGDTIKIVKE